MTTWHKIVSLQRRSTMKRNGAAYRTPGYYLRLYRQRAELTQSRAAGQAGDRNAVYPAHTQETTRA